MLVDDNSNDNFFHQRIINKSNLSATVISKSSGSEALKYLKFEEDNILIQPDLIFLDINMPGMNGWEFLEEYKKMETRLKTHLIIIMLTTSERNDDIIKAKSYNLVSDLVTKPLSNSKLEEINNKYFTKQIAL